MSTTKHTPEPCPANVIVETLDESYRDPRYNSGTSLDRTDKERLVEKIEALAWDGLTDEAFMDLKKLKIATLKELVERLSERPS